MTHSLLFKKGFAVIVALSFIAPLVTLPVPASALSCMAPLYTEMIKTGAIAIATVTDVAYSTSLGGPQSNRVTVSVERGWGNVQQTMTFSNPLRRTWTGYAEGGAPIPFENGKRYVIVMSQNNAGQLEAAMGDCSSSFQIVGDEQLQNFISARVAEGMGQGTFFSEYPTPSPVPCTSDDCMPTTPRNYCPQLNTTFSRGARDATTGGQVSELQRFISDYYDIDESVIVSGFFGRNTHKYVVQFQSEQGLPAYGIVGSMTRAKIAAVCGGGSVVIPPITGCTKEYKPVCGQPPMPVCPPNMSCIQAFPQPQTYGNSCLMKQAGAGYLYDGMCRNDAICPMIAYDQPICNPNERLEETKNGQCPGPWRCVPTWGVGSPTISSFSGPVKLSVGETGTWRIIASDSSNGTLSYSIDWGEIRTFDAPYAASMMEKKVTQNTSFTHSYSSPGTYTVTMTVTNQNGKSAQTTSTVTVAPAIDPPYACTMQYQPVCATPSYCLISKFAPGAYPRECQYGKTYGNSCSAKADGAVYKYDGECLDYTY